MLKAAGKPDAASSNIAAAHLAGDSSRAHHADVDADPSVEGRRYCGRLAKMVRNKRPARRVNPERVTASPRARALDLPECPNKGMDIALKAAARQPARSLQRRTVTFPYCTRERNA